MRVFFDTSAFAKRFIAETGSEQADNMTLKATEMGLSVICFPELMSALNRKRREKLITQEIYWDLKRDILKDIEDTDIINLTPSVLNKTTELLENNALRSLDAMHLACAIEWKAELFVSSDKRQVTAAIDSGLDVAFIEGTGI